MPPPTRAVLLDFYGTVVHEDTALIRTITERVAASLDHAATAREVGSHWWRAFGGLCASCHGPGFRTQRDLEVASLRQTLDALGSGLSARALGAELVAFWRRPPLFDDVHDALAALEVPVCIVSDIDRADVLAAIDHHGLGFDRVVTSEDARAYKPRPEIFALALEELNLRPEDVVHVGDSVTRDVAGAQAAGIRPVRIQRTGRLDPAGPVPTIRSLAELPALTAAGRPAGDSPA